MWDFVFNWMFITGLFVGGNFALLAFALCSMSKKASVDPVIPESPDKKDFNEWLKNTPR